MVKPHRKLALNKYVLSEGHGYILLPKEIVIKHNLVCFLFRYLANNCWNTTPQNSVQKPQLDPHCFSSLISHSLPYSSYSLIWWWGRARSLPSQNALSCPHLCCACQGSDQVLSPGQHSALSQHSAHPVWNVLQGVNYFPFYIVCSFPRCHSAAYKQSLREEAGILELKCEDKRTSLFLAEIQYFLQSWMKAIAKVAPGETQVHQPSIYQGTVNIEVSSIFIQYHSYCSYLKIFMLITTSKFDGG